MLPKFQISNFKFQIILILFLFSIFFLLPSAAYADTDPANPSAGSGQANYPTPNTNPDVPNNLHNWTQTVMIEVMSSLTCQIAGVDHINPKQSCLGADQQTGKIGFLPSPQSGGAIGFMGNMISVLYTPPLHTGDYFQNLAQNFGITKKTYAQTTGTGFQSLTPLIGIWSAFRNIVYLVLVIIFVAIGLAIMLRVKIDPRTVMTIQNQIPKIIVGILAVTFSFAIAGFLIDMMWVFIYLIYGIISGIPGANVADLNPAVMQGQSALGAAGRISSTGIFGIAGDATQGLADIFKNLIGAERCDNPLNCMNALFDPFNFFLKTSVGGVQFNAFDLIYNLLSGVAGTAIFFKMITVPLPNLGEGIPGVSAFFQLAAETGKLATSVSAATVIYAGTQFFLREALPFIIIYLIIFIAILVALFRLWFTLLMAYVQILLAVVLAPFWIIGGIVPGSPISIGGWFRNIGANILAFPVVIAMFMLGRVFMDTFEKSSAIGQNFVPPLIGNPGDPSLIGSLIGLGIILMTPNVVNMLKAALKAPKTDTGLGKAIGVGVGGPQRLVGGAMSTAFSPHMATDPKTGQTTLVYPHGTIGRFLRGFGFVRG